MKYEMYKLWIYLKYCKQWNYQYSISMIFTMSCREFKILSYTLNGGKTAWMNKIWIYYEKIVPIYYLNFNRPFMHFLQTFMENFSTS